MAAAGHERERDEPDDQTTPATPHASLSSITPENWSGDGSLRPVPPPKEFRAPKGTRDVLPPESARWTALVAAFGADAARAGYGLALSPVFEDVEVFQRVGESTDVVRKEMYDFHDKGDRHLALRPEGTAQLARAFVEHRPTPPWKVWYVGQYFRNEQPQAGRYRQFHQLGVEVMGTDDPEADVEVIGLAWSFYAALGLRKVTLELNSLGDGECRPAYRTLLREHLSARRDVLCAEHRDRLEENPLRVLDCKRPACVAATADAPRQLDHLCEPCAQHLARVRAGLEAQAVPYTMEPRLVRGLDYYTRTTFEYVSDALESAQDALGGGGRYDGLVEELGGPPTPSIGFSLGVERILLACDAEGAFAGPGDGADVFVVDTAGGRAAGELSRVLRAAGIRTDRAFDNRSMKAQFKLADRSGARLALVVGPDEEARGVVKVQGLDSPDDETVARPDVVEAVRKRLAAGGGDDA
jgi:histidyl-tRNA synthetase